jgi:hypothetical protein
MAAALLAMGGASAEAQIPAAAAHATDAPAPVYVRNADGRVTVRATPIVAPLRIDGTLDDSVYQTTPSIDAFIQQERARVSGDRADEVHPPTATTSTSPRCYDSQPHRTSPTTCAGRP